jgi:hypothetical protein
MVIFAVISSGGQSALIIIFQQLVKKVKSKEPRQSFKAKSITICKA